MTGVEEQRERFLARGGFDRVCLPESEQSHQSELHDGQWVSDTQHSEVDH